MICLAGYLIGNMKELLQIFDTSLYSELFHKYNDGGRTKKLLGKDTVFVEKTAADLARSWEAR